MAIRVGINGFGRIGRNVFRAGLSHNEIEFVAVNDLPFPIEAVAHLLKYDSIQGRLDAKVEIQDTNLLVNGKLVRFLSARSPEDIIWGDLGVDIVVESTGVFTDGLKAVGHLKAGAKKVIISAPAKNEDITIVMGVNEASYQADKHNIISNASCTTNCLAPLAKILLDNFGINYGLMTTIHSYTNDQNILDLPHKKDMRRARAAALSMIPTSTGAAKAIGLVIPELKGRLDGLAIRVPTPNVSIVDLVCELGREADTNQINLSIKQAAEDRLKGIVEYIDEPLVSRDFYGNSASCIFDAELTRLVEGKMVKVFAWYDNEWGYSCRVVDLIEYIAQKGLA